MTDLLDAEIVPPGPAPRPGRAARKAPRRKWGTYALYAFTVLGIAYLLLPLLSIAVLSFNQPAGRRNTSWNEFTWSNWRHAFADTNYRDAFVESIKVGLAACTLATILGGLIAIAISRDKMRGGSGLNMLLVLPLTTPEIVLGASTFTLFFNVGIDRGFWTIVVAHTTFCISFVALTVKARLRGLDWSLEDAAADLGSPPLRTFFKVTFPTLVPGLAGAFLLSLSLSLDDYIITSFVAGQTVTFPRQVWDSAVREVVPQVHVLTTLVMLIVIAILVGSTVAGFRRTRATR